MNTSVSCCENDCLLGSASAAHQTSESERLRIFYCHHGFTSTHKSPIRTSINITKQQMTTTQQNMATKLKVEEKKGEKLLKAETQQNLKTEHGQTGFAKAMAGQLKKNKVVCEAAKANSSGKQEHCRVLNFE